MGVWQGPMWDQAGHFLNSMVGLRNNFRQRGMPGEGSQLRNTTPHFTAWHSDLRLSWEVSLPMEIILPWHLLPQCWPYAFQRVTLPTNQHCSLCSPGQESTGRLMGLLFAWFHPIPSFRKRHPQGSCLITMERGGSNGTSLP